MVATQSRPRDRVSRAFLLTFVALVGSQVLLYPPGTDVSPWAYTVLGTRPTVFLGQTVQTWALVALGLVCIVGLVRRAERPLPGFSAVLMCGALLSLGTLLRSDSISLALEGLAKLLLPPIVFMYLSPRVRPFPRDSVYSLVLVVNLFVVAQSLLSFVLTGSFAANTYYHELRHEYFGYFHHPFAFAGALGVCSLVVLARILQPRPNVLLLVLLGVNLWLILATQVRTFIVAVLVAVAFALVYWALHRKRSAALVFVIGIMAIGAISGVNLPRTDRVTSDLSSGRLERWTVAVDYVLGSDSWLSLLFGGGPETIQRVNQEHFGVYINSLNIAIDVLVDSGLVGIVLFSTVWVIIGRHAFGVGNKGLVLSLCVFMTLASVLSNAYYFPFVATLFAIALAALRSEEFNAPDTLSKL